MRHGRSDQVDSSGQGPRRRRRPRYPGTHPRRFEHRYKELQAEAYPGIRQHVRARGMTPAGTHVPVLLQEVLEVLQPAPGQIVADCTLGYGGHAEAFLARIGPAGRLFGFDVDAAQIERTRQRLAGLNHNPSLHRSNFAGIGKVLAAEKLDGYDVILADLGVSSMQVDDPARGFSYKHDGPLDMRMDSRLPRTAADWLRVMTADELAAALDELADEPDYRRIAEAIVRQRASRPILRTGDLVRLIFEVKRLTMREWRHRPQERQRDLHPAARTFQALRILVNDELGCLRQLLRIAPACLRPGGRIGIISFHSGEDRLTAQAFREGRDAGVYEAVSPEPMTPSPAERRDNPRSSSARLRWARRSAAL